MTKESVEDALTKDEGDLLHFCPEYQGESIAFEPGGSGFYTTTELSKENPSHNFAPIYYYPFSKANMLIIHSHLLFLPLIISFFQSIK